VNDLVFRSLFRRRRLATTAAIALAAALSACGKGNDQQMTAAAPPAATTPPAGFAPAPRPVPAPAPVPIAAPATRRTIAPRFAARLAEESARVRGGSATDGQAPAAPATAPAPAPAPATAPGVAPAAAPASVPVAAPAPANAPAAAATPPVAAPAVQAARASAPAPAQAPSPTPVHAPAPAPAATPAQAPAPAPAAAAPQPQPAPTPAPVPAPAAAEASTDLEVPLPELDVDEPAPRVVEERAAAPARQPRTITVPEPGPRDDAAERIAVDEAPAPAPAPRSGRSTMPSRLAEHDDDDDEGPVTLASLLPDASEWPRRGEPRKRRREKPPAAASASAALATAHVSSHDARFLREARRDARWSRPWVRASLGLALVVLVLGAAAQLAWPMRDTLAARFPVTRPAWDMLCEQLGCRIEAPRALASLALDGSALTRTNTEHVLLFSADLHNRSDQEVRMPSFDLTFMDLNGEIVARKVLSPEQVGIRQKALGPDAELHVHARLQVGGTLDASGFQAYLFYP